MGGKSGQAKGQSISTQGQGEQHQPRAVGGNISRNEVNIPIIREGNHLAEVDEEDTEPRRPRKRDKVFSFVEKQLEKHCPKGASFIGKLKELYNFPQDRQSESALLKDIVNSLVK